MLTSQPERAKTLKRAAFVVVPLLFVGMLGWVMVARTVRVRIGQPPPAFTLPAFDGGRVSLADLKGRPVVINFWASWCLPCRQEAPDLAEVAQRYADSDVVLLGINSRDLQNKAEDYISDYRLEGWTHLRDADAAVASRYGVPRYPETFFVDRDGTLVDHWRGPMTLAEMSERIDRIRG